MPGNLEHSQHSYRTVRVEASDLHEWMDAPWRRLGLGHRFLRHDPSEAPDWAVAKYGEETARLVMEDHVRLDDYDFLEDMRELLIWELQAEVRESTRMRARRRLTLP